MLLKIVCERKVTHINVKEKLNVRGVIDSSVKVTGYARDKSLYIRKVIGYEKEANSCEKEVKWCAICFYDCVNDVSGLVLG